MSNIDYDFDMEFNREVVLENNNSIWVSEDEGGISGGCLSEYSNNITTKYCILGFNSNAIYPNSFLPYADNILVGCAAGIVLINKKLKQYIHYQLLKDPKRMRIYEIKFLNKSIWGVREDGLVKFDLVNKSAIHYTNKDERVSNDMFEVFFFANSYYFSNESNLYIIKNI